MKIDLMRNKETSLSKLDLDKSCTSLRIWHCKFKTLKELAHFPKLEELIIAGFPDSSLEFARGLKKLCFLRIIHLPKVKDLGGLEHLENLRTLSLETLPSWDASKKVQTVESLDPLSSLASLEHLALFGVVPENGSLKELEKCKKLKSAQFTKYDEKEVNRFYSANGVANKGIPASSFD